MFECRSCGANWSEGRFSTDCKECGGGALEIDCRVCGGKCGVKWKRAIMDSQDYKLAHWIGGCALPEEEKLSIMWRYVKENYPQALAGKSEEEQREFISKLI